MRTIDVISDAICPWCWIGKAHLDAALAELARDGLDFRVRWKPFQLNPDMPEEGVERAAYRAAKFGSVERGKELDAQVAEAGRAAGLDFRHDLMLRTPNTVAAHRVIRAAEQAGVQQPVVDALFRAYFQEGRDIGDAAVLDEVSADAGLPGMAAMLASDAHRDAVLAEDMAARRGGINGVPSFLMDRHLLFSGAMPGPRMAEAFRQADAILSEREKAA
ncbi:disulfide bond formation protein DsbA [Falsiroseomonas bella]|uniref:Disulfide bond formation protein DsbA n=1 Tax=Falsiroseomonas bella TaxID=2184016 RepID=A0A317FDP4_9PROT|nr:DsbA family oxidoreductase [Falsiroseomonas bella]PWS37005.1 disulfide bond formation protein DsbA [Falsiroseomonas bella]